jgi:hypothetical protein
MDQKAKKTKADADGALRAAVWAEEQRKADAANAARQQRARAAIKARAEATQANKAARATAPKATALGGMQGQLQVLMALKDAGNLTDGEFQSALTNLAS